MSQSLRELGMDLIADGNWSRALGVLAEAVRRQPADHRARMLAARCYAKLGENERAVTESGTPVHEKAKNQVAAMAP